MSGTVVDAAAAIPLEDDESLGRHHAEERSLTRQERLTRDSQIMALIDRGVDARTVGARFGLTDRQVRRIKRAYRELTPLAQIDIPEVIEDTFAGYTAAIEELAVLSAGGDIQGSVRIAAIRTRLEAWKGRLEILQSLGYAPHDLGQIRVLEDNRLMTAAFVKVLQAFAIPEDAVEALLNVVEGREVKLPDGETLALPAGSA